MHDQIVRILVRYNDKTRRIEVTGVRAYALGQDALDSEFVEPVSGSSAAPDERYWPVLRLGDTELVLCEIAAE